MDIREARSFANRSVRLGWTDRTGATLTDIVFVYEVNFVPFYGPCFITSKGEIRLDRVVACQLIEPKVA